MSMPPRDERRWREECERLQEAWTEQRLRAEGLEAELKELRQTNQVLIEAMCLLSDQMRLHDEGCSECPGSFAKARVIALAVLGEKGLPG